MNATIQYIEEELKGFYPAGEVKAITRLIFKHVCQRDYYMIRLDRDYRPDNCVKKNIYEIVRRLKTNEPIQYILGETEFYDLPIIVKPGVLIPRPETEELVRWIIESVNISSPSILDIGTGSGCIALSLKKMISDAQVSAFDHSELAVNIARQNSKNNNLDVKFFHADIFNWESAIWDIYDVIVSNPPYVLEKEKREMSDNVLKFEPEDALFVRNDEPLLFYFAITRFAQRYLSEGGWLYFEINESLGGEMVKLLSEEKFKNVELKKDINGKDRMIRGRK